MPTSTNQMKIRKELEGKEDRNETVNNEDVNIGIKECSVWDKSAFKDSRIFCILLLVFSCHVYSSTTTFFALILALDNFHLEVIQSKLLFVNAAIVSLADTDPCKYTTLHSKALLILFSTS